MFLRMLYEQKRIQTLITTTPRNRRRFRCLKARRSHAALQGLIVTLRFSRVCRDCVCVVYVCHNVCLFLCLSVCLSLLGAITLSRLSVLLHGIP